MARESRQRRRRVGRAPRLPPGAGLPLPGRPTIHPGRRSAARVTGVPAARVGGATCARPERSCGGYQPARAFSRPAR
ncbi:MAG: hypothetical protein E6G25_08045 [Actinobacteria bacterium]|nr:MAG: hypothetical protein E6G25_08045 [Actinomycetota bacterium]